MAEPSTQASMAKKSRKGTPKTPSLFNATLENGNEVKVAWRKDRNWLISIYEGKSQVCQVTPSKLELPSSQTLSQNEFAEDCASTCPLLISRNAFDCLLCMFFA